MILLRQMRAADLPRFTKWLYTAHVAKWYHEPQDWIDEVARQDGVFSWIHHFIVESHGIPIGFCQYYACKDSGELWEGYTAMGGSYSIDYMIGEAAYLRRGIGRQIVAALTDRLRLHSDAVRIVVQPEPENAASCGLLLACGFVLDAAKGVYVKELRQHDVGNTVKARRRPMETCMPDRDVKTQ